MTQSESADDVGMDHPFFMASAQAGMDAHFALAAGLPLEQALLSIGERMAELFGELPAGLVEERVRSVYGRPA